MYCHLQQDVIDSQINVKLVDKCESGDADCKSVNEVLHAEHSEVKVSSNFTDAQIERMMSGLKDVKVIKFSSMVGVFGGFENKDKAVKFSNRIKRYAGLWCCIHAHPGHIWYDMEHDTFPHTDRHNRVWDKEWKPKAGP